MNNFILFTEKLIETKQLKNRATSKIIRFNRQSDMEQVSNNSTSGVLCSTHKQMTLRYVCIERDCEERIFCGHCLRNKKHAQHLDKVYTLDEMLNFTQEELWENFQNNRSLNFKSHFLQDYLDNKRMQLIAMVEKEFKDLQRYLYEELDNQKKDQEEQIKQIQEDIKEIVSSKLKINEINSKFQSIQSYYSKQDSPQFFLFDYSKFENKFKIIDEQLKNLKTQVLSYYQVVPQENIAKLNQIIKDNFQKSIPFGQKYFQNEIKLNNKEEEETDCSLIIQHRQDDIKIGFSSIVMSIQITFLNKDVDLPCRIKLINDSFERTIVSASKQKVYQICSSELIKAEEEKINLTEKPFTLVINEFNQPMALEFKDNNSIVFVEEKDLKQISHLTINLKNQSYEIYGGDDNGLVTISKSLKRMEILDIKYILY